MKRTGGRPGSAASEGSTPPGAVVRAGGLEVLRPGTVPYGEALALQADLVRRRRGGEIPDQLILLEHPHVVTLGTGADESNVLLGEDERRLIGMELFDTGRGGDVTYHGPGQLVGYPILALEEARHDLHRYVRELEEVLIRALTTFGIEGVRIPGLTGVWVGEAKIAAIGVRVSSGWITSHGFALNVSTDLRYFDAIVPCGIREKGVTSMARVLGEVPAMGAVEEAVVQAFTEVFGRVPARSSGEAVG